jgi:hypothetical protein
MERLWRVFMREERTEVSFEEKVRRVLDCSAEEQQWVQQWLQDLLEDLLQEDQSFLSVALDYGPCLSFCLEASFFHQLISVLSAVFARSLLPELSSFFASLWRSLRLQPLIAHEHFSQATVRLFTNAIALWPPEYSEETALIALLRAVFERLEACPAYEGLFIVDSETGARVFILLELVEKMVDYVDILAINEDLLTAIRCCFLLEDTPILDTYLINSQLSALIVSKMWLIVDFSLGSFREESSSAADAQILQIATCLDSVLSQSFSSALIENLRKDLFMRFFLPIRPVLTRGHWKAKIALLRLLSDIGKAINSEHFTSLFAYFISEIDPFSEANLPAFSWENRGFWNCLNCGKEEIRILSLHLLYILIGKMHWKVLYPLFPDELQCTPITHYCSPEALLETLPGAQICNFRDTDRCLTRENCLLAMSSTVADSITSPVPAGQSLLLDHLLGKFERIWDNSLRENVLVTGILGRLCLYPGCTQAGRSLHRRLLGELQGTRSRYLFASLRSVMTMQISERVQSTYSSAVEEQLLLSKAAFTRDEPATQHSPYVEVVRKQNLLLFQEFTGEICTILTVQRTFELAQYLL